MAAHTGFGLIWFTSFTGLDLLPLVSDSLSILAEHIGGLTTVPNLELEL